MRAAFAKHFGGRCFAAATVKETAARGMVNFTVKKTQKVFCGNTNMNGETFVKGKVPSFF